MSNNAHALVNKYLRGEVDELEGSTLTKRDNNFAATWPTNASHFHWESTRKGNKMERKRLSLWTSPGTLDDNDTTLPKERKANIKKMFQIYGQKPKNKKNISKSSQFSQSSVYVMCQSVLWAAGMVSDGCGLFYWKFIDISRLCRMFYRFFTKSSWKFVA